MKTVPVILKKISDIVSKKVVKNTKFSKLDTKVNSLENKNPYVTSLVHINQYNTDIKNSEKKIGDVDKKLDVSDFVATATTEIEQSVRY